MARSRAIWGGVLCVAALLDFGAPARAGDPMAGASLYSDVRRFESFGTHRYGSPGAEQALSWIAEELGAAGLSVSSQSFSIKRQYAFESGTLTINGRSIAVAPHWWLPSGQASFSLTAPLVATGDAAGAFVRLTLPFDNRSYLTGDHREALQAAFQRNPAAVLLTIDHPSGEIFTYNVDQSEVPWPVPVILVGARDKLALDAAEAAAQPLSLVIKGTYRADVAGHNVIGRLERGKPKTLIISTPVTSWFTSTCERAPGIAGFLALARWAREALPNVNLVFVATAGHEIGHGGMEHFIRTEAPKPAQTAAWVHLGASLACYHWEKRDGTWATDKIVDTRVRLINRSQSLDATVRKTFGAIKGIDRIGEAAAIGELREIYAAGYADFFGMAGQHQFFHTPADTAAATGPEALEPVIRAFAETLKEIDAAKL